MSKKFQNLRNKISEERREKIDAMTKDLQAEMPLYELRRARQLSQEQLAEMLEIKQGSVSKLERRTDLYISTLRRYIEAMGGELTLQARFPEGAVNITQLSQIDESDSEADRQTA